MSGMTEEKFLDKKINRRQALKYIGGGVAGLLAAAYGLNRAGFLAFLADDAKDENPLKVDRRKMRNIERPLLGFGCMRLPVLNKDYAQIDTELAEKMIDYAYRHGINYFDTAYPYHRGLSETFLGNTLKKYPRDSYYLSDKMPGWMIKNLDDAKRIFEEQLQKCQVDYFDNYFLHALSNNSNLGNLSTDFSQVYEKLGVLSYLQEQKRAGRIHNLGFSYHGDVPFFEELLEKYDWDMVMIDLNYLDWSHADDDRFKNLPAANNGRFAGEFYKRLEKKGIPTYVMEPVRGGQLARLNPAAVKVLKNADPDSSTASWALRFVGSLSNVVCTLSGMTNFEHVVDNVNTMSDFRPLTTAEHKIIDNALEAFLSHETIFCTGCRYCVPCPYGVDIPNVFQAFNDASGNLGIPDPEHPAENYAKQKEAFLVKYNNMVAKSAQADRCIGCGKCKALCPQRLDIPKHMRRVDDMVSKLK